MWDSNLKYREKERETALPAGVANQTQTTLVAVSVMQNASSSEETQMQKDEERIIW